MKYSPIYVGGTDIWGSLPALYDRDLELQVAQLITEINSLCKPGWPVGLEKVFLEKALGKISTDDNLYDVLSFGEITYKPSFVHISSKLFRKNNSELICYKLWHNDLREFCIVPNVIDLSTFLTGAKFIRSTRSFTTPFFSGHSLEYCCPTLIMQRLDNLQNNIVSLKYLEFPFLSTVAAFFDFLVIHPLNDANGRASRIFFQLLLRRFLGLEKPTIPLSLGFFTNPTGIMNAYLHCHFRNDARLLVKHILGSIENIRDCLEEYS